MFERGIVGEMLTEDKMKIIIYIIAVILLLGLQSSWADEIVLKTGEIISGDVLDLTETTLSINVDGQERVIDRVRIEAVFLGEQAPFSTKGYPGLLAGSPSHQPDVKRDEYDE